MNHFYINNEQIIKAMKVENGIVYGYNVATEEFVSAKESGCILMTKELAKIICTERVPIVLAMAFSKTVKEAAKILGKTERSFYRLRHRHVYNQLNN